ncbi:hypothetical protein TanjilG_33070 [Lupinus angustifolius]|uniref:Uncharacterized protein n=1 Tax=Lupinus angustifolius TaxID=3871 RepID=A0A1J7IGW9_LUPAN|nr:hypothetical protein TanjilG_33070 [Lupinus angustifolius]
MKNKEVVHEAWTHLRIESQWVRKVGVLKHHVVQKLKYLGHPTTPSMIHNYEHELSFDKTPRYCSSYFCFNISSINPKANFDQDFEYDNGRKSSLFGIVHEDEDYCYGYEEEEIDKRAEEFIAKFYQQMKFQRENLQCNEIHNRD